MGSVDYCILACCNRLLGLHVRVISELVLRLASSVLTAALDSCLRVERPRLLIMRPRAVMAVRLLYSHCLSATRSFLSSSAFPKRREKTSKPKGLCVSSTTSKPG